MRSRLGFALALAISAIVAAGCSDLGEPVAPRAFVSPAALDFGTLAVGGSTTRSVTVTNTGTADFVGTAGVSCAGFTIDAGAGPFTVPPGGEHTVVVRFTPGGHGSFVCELSLGAGLSPVALSGQAVSQFPGALCVVTPLTLDFGWLRVGGAGNGMAFKISNPGTEPTQLDVRSDDSDFTPVTGAGQRTLAPGESLQVIVRFRPSQGGRDSCLVSTGPGCPQVRARGVGTTVSFATDLRPVLDFRGCNSGCHTRNFYTPTDLVNVTSVGYAPAKRIVPFDLAASVLYGKITNSGQYGQSMPQGSPLIPLSERDLFRAWILEGATDN